MSREFWLVTVGGLIGLVSSLAAALLSHWLGERRLKAQLERENLLRKEEREREDLLRREEREREDLLRREERERDDHRRHEEVRRQSMVREVDMLFRDIQRLRKIRDELPQADTIGRDRLARETGELENRRYHLQMALQQLESTGSGKKP